MSSTGVLVIVGVCGFLILFLLFCTKKSRRLSNESNDVPAIKVHPYIGEPQQVDDHRITIPLSEPSAHPPAVAARPSPPVLTISTSSGFSNPLPPPAPWICFEITKRTFTYEELSMATNEFDKTCLIGQGGYASVYRGALSDGKQVAIKQLKTGSGHGGCEFEVEVEISSRVHHKHLVSLVGYCITGPERFLVYDFVPNKTLDFHLYGKNCPVMDFSTRMKIALGTAKGLAYLHEDCHPKIIHRDIKAANILLDDNLEVKIADFGFAKITPDFATHVSTRVMGTFGYVAPEYALSGKLTYKSDVYSFGVVLLELITGRRPVDSARTSMDGSLVDWARPLLMQSADDGDFDCIVDWRLNKEYSQSQMSRMVFCAAACVRHSAHRRPMMSQVVRALEGDVSLFDLNDGIRPGHSSDHVSHTTSDDKLIMLSLLKDF